MLHTMRRVFASLSLLILVTLLISPQSTSASSASFASEQEVQTPRHTSLLPLTKFQLRGLDGPYHTQGNLILGADNQPYLFHGMARDDLEYFCKGDGHYTAKELGYLGIGQNTAKETYWGGNTVRLPLSENFWLYGSSSHNPSENCSPNQYQSLVKQTIDHLTALAMNVIIDLHRTNAGGQIIGSGTQLAMPDADSVLFWQQVALIYAKSPNVLFEAFNEPHILDWSCWVNGCAISGDMGTDHHYYSYQGVGMQKLVETIRATGATNLILVGGLNWGYDLSQLNTYHLRGQNLVYDTHPYDYYGKYPSNWDASFGNVSSAYPLFVAEFGEYDCKTAYVSQLINYLDAHNISWVGWAWVVASGNPCSYPQAIKNYNGTPYPDLGQYEYERMKGYINLMVNEEVPEKRK
jgi:endoglucanase